MSTSRAAYAAVFAGMLINAGAIAQATDPHVFVANDGNLEGSVSSMLVNPDGTLTLSDRVVTGSRASTSQPCAGCNPYAIDLSPNGAYLATNHASGSTGEQITVLSVDAEGSLGIVHTRPLAEGGLDLAWVRDDLLAVCITDLSGGNQLRLYRWDAGAETLVLTDTDAAGSFLTSIAVHPSGSWIYANDSFAGAVRQFEVVGESALLIDTVPMPVSGVSLGVSPDGRYLYAAGGISAGGNAFAGYAIDPGTGLLESIPGSPFASPGSSPKGFAFTPDGAYLYLSHGSDATIRAFGIDTESGVPTPLGFSFDVGLQGTLRGMDMVDGRLFAVDESDIIDGLEGVYAFDVDPATGGFSSVPGTPVPTGGISPDDIVAWAGAGGSGCRADLAEPFGVLNFFDVAAFIGAYNAGDPGADLAGPFGVLNFFDVAAYIGSYNAGCPSRLRVR